MTSRRYWILGAHHSLFLLFLILALAAYLRLYNLFPVQKGLQAPQDYDEAVWDSTAQLLLQGYLPYRDFFATLPPVGIYLLGGVLRLVYVPWGSGLGLMATRYASVIYGLITVILVYCVGRKLAGRAAGLAAAGLLAEDGMVIGMDRLAMLEPPLNLFSALAVLAYLSVFDPWPGDVRNRPQPASSLHSGQALGHSPEGRRGSEGAAKRAAYVSLCATGVLAALATLTKTPGMVVILALLTVSLLRRRWREAFIIAVSFALTWLALSSYFLLRCPGDFVRQVYFFQLLRPADGVVRRLTRLYDMWHYAQAWSTVRIGAVGGLFVGWLAIRRREARAWLVVLAWAGYTLLLIMANSSYYPQYYVQLAVPLCLLGGGLLDTRIEFRGRWRILGSRVPGMATGVLVVGTILLIGLVSGQIAHQPKEIMSMLRQADSTYIEVANYLHQNSSPDTRVLVFEPNYTFLSARPPAGARPGRFLVDSYGEMLYVNLDLQAQSLWTLTKAALTGRGSQLPASRPAGLQPTFWRRPAQEQVLAALERAEYVVIDGRARYQMEPQTLSAIMARSSEVFSSGVASLRRVTSSE